VLAWQSTVTVPDLCTTCTVSYTMYCCVGIPEVYQVLYIVHPFLLFECSLFRNLVTSNDILSDPRSAVCVGIGIGIGRTRTVSYNKMLYRQIYKYQNQQKQNQTNLKNQ